MLETGTSGLMSGDEKRDDALPSAPALVLDSTQIRLKVPIFAYFRNREAAETKDI
jgi:hypothetical protein